MFNAFKKLTGRSGAGADGANGPNGQPPPGLTTMSVSLQKKFGKGVHYNMKIILKGDRNVGKTQLFRRLQGLPFLEEYTATEEIQVANITWNYKTSDDIVKVEIWDIVDVANKKKRLPTDKLKLENSSGSSAGQENGDSGAHDFALDANTIDVYKNTNGVILVFDITKLWTFDYVKREIDNVPDHIPILIMGNRRDMGHHRAVASDTVTYFIEGLERDTAEIRYAESSMRNGFGLKYIHKFFNLPYLHLQKEALLKQLEVNRQETEITIQELEYYAEGDDANYDLFIDGLSQKRRQVADALAPQKLSLAEAQAVASAKALKDTKPSDAGAVAARLAIKSDPTTNRTLDGAPASMTRSQSIIQSNSSITPDQFKSSSNGANPKNHNAELIQGNQMGKGNRSNFTSAKSGPGGVEDFVPDDDIHKIISFLDDGINGSGQQIQQQPKNTLNFDDSSDEDGGGGGGSGDRNPMVVAVEEDIDEDNEEFAKSMAKISSASISKSMPGMLDLSSSEDEGKRVQDEGPEPFDSLNNIRSSKSSLGLGNISNSKLGFQVFVQDGENKGESSGASASGDSKEKKSSKKDKHRKSKHKKKKEHLQKLQHHTPDLEDFLSGEPGSRLESVDTSAYEAL